MSGTASSRDELLQQIAALRRENEELRRENGRLRQTDGGSGAGLYEKVLDALPISVTLVDRDGNYLFVNRFEASRWGYERQAVIGRNAYDVLPIEISALARKQDSAVKSTGKPTPLFEERAKNFSQERDLLIGKFPIADGDGTVLGVAMMAQDITDKKKAEQLLKASESSYRASLEFFPDPVYITVDNRIVFANRAAAQQFAGETGRDLIGLPSTELFHVDEHDRIRAMRNTVKRLGQTSSSDYYTNIRLDGTEFRSEGASTEITWDGKPAIAVVLRDVTDRLANEAARAEIHNRYALVISATHDGIWEKDFKTGEVHRSETLFQIVGYDPDGFKPTTEQFDALVHPDDADMRRNAMRAHLQSKEPYDCEYRVRHKSGHYIWVRAKAMAVWDEGGNPVRIAGSLSDISDLKAAQDALEKRARELARSNEELEQFAYLASHDMQEPLRMIGSYCSLLSLRYADRLDDDGRDFLAYAVDGAQRMRDLIDDLLTYSRAGRGEITPRPVPLSGVLEDVCARLQNRISEEAASVSYGDLPTVNGDTVLLTQLFQNLVLNAIKFHGDEPPVVTISAEQTEKSWVVSVRDNGIGIDPEHRNQVFRMFQRLHGRAQYEGNGLGLALCKRVVQRHNGEIWISPTDGPGTTIRFSIAA